MKHLPSLFCCIIFLHSCAKQNINLKSSPITKIDSISNLNELRKFVTNADESLKQFMCISPHVYKSEELASSPLKAKLDSLIPKKDYLKADFDGNGLMDLVITGSVNFSFNALAILDQGDDIYKVIQLAPLLHHSQFPIYTQLIMKNQKPLIEVYEKSSSLVNEDFVKSVLVYKDGNFVEYQDTPANYQISKIEFGTTGCFGTCPVFDMTIVPSGKSKFHARYFNFSQQRASDEEEGQFETELKPSDFNAIVQMMNELNIKALESNYRVGWTDDQTIKIKVTFANGSFKFIQDYGMRGTRGLMLLYEKLLALRFNQDWQRI